jgi:hypothetical protein
MKLIFSEVIREVTIAPDLGNFFLHLSYPLNSSIKIKSTGRRIVFKNNKVMNLLVAVFSIVTTQFYFLISIQKLTLFAAVGVPSLIRKPTPIPANAVVLSSTNGINPQAVSCLSCPKKSS